MKYRNGFVSNSSTSSFLIYGISCESIEEKKFISDYDDNDNYDEDDTKKILVNVNDEKIENLVVYGPEDRYLGRCLTECKDDETMGEFKRRVRGEIESVLGIEIAETKFSFIEEAWRDG